MEEEDIATALLVGGKADNLEVKTTGWTVRLGCQGCFAQTIQSKRAKSFRGGEKLASRGQEELIVSIK